MEGQENLFPSGQHSSVPLPPHPPIIKSQNLVPFSRLFVEQEGSRAAPLPSCLVTLVPVLQPSFSAKKPLADRYH